MVQRRSNGMFCMANNKVVLQRWFLAPQRPTGAVHCVDRETSAFGAGLAALWQCRLHGVALWR
ncbi:hypothetical protein L484_004037 [Morus notabilis]|uniref:Uncharacterized protein n=1 Tax=Morus notabilis TaxID=981085 RepID=W9RA38_9ROSA|nr:hypothetical protein L484_004037 [Morus notabilis]